MDWIAAILELSGKWITGHKNRFGWLFSTAASSVWIFYVFYYKTSYGLLVVCIPAIIINLMNFYKWSKNR